MLRSLGDPALCDGHASRDFVDIDVQFFVKSCLLDFAAAVFYNDSRLIFVFFWMTSRLLCVGEFCVAWCAWYFCNWPCNPRGEVAGSTLRGFVYFCDRCFAACDPLGKVAWSTFTLWCELHIHVSQVQNCRERGPPHVSQVQNCRFQTSVPGSPGPSQGQA